MVLEDETKVTEIPYSNVIEQFKPEESVFLVGAGLSYRNPSHLPRGNELRNAYLETLARLDSSLTPFIKTRLGNKVWMNFSSIVIKISMAIVIHPILHL